MRGIKSKKSFAVSGSEPVCAYNLFSKPHGIVRNNCYAWALQVGNSKGPLNFKLQPGDLSSRRYFHLQDCHDVKRRVLEDLRVIGGFEKKSGMMTPCKKDHYVIAMILSPDRDYHFLLFHNDIRYKADPGETVASVAKRFGVARTQVSYLKQRSFLVKNARVWSHKRGTAEAPTLFDSKKQIIKDPRTATFDYGWLKYDTFCTFFCVKRRDRGPSVVSNAHGVMIVERMNKVRKKI